MSDALSRVKNQTGQKFVIIIDEWDVLIRDEAQNQAVQENYINFFKLFPFATCTLDVYDKT